MEDWMAEPKPAGRLPIVDTAPSADQVTDYDRVHAATYLRLLDAVDAAASWTEISQILLEINPKGEPARAMRRYESHLARAQWLANHGYRDLLRGRP